MSKPRTLGELSKSPYYQRRNLRVRDEMRENLVSRMRAREELFPGIVGYDETVGPQIVNALLSRHHFILLGLRGQAKTRIIRGLTRFLDEEVPVVAGCEIHDDPYRPLCRACRMTIPERGDETPIQWLTRDERYVEKLATPDVTIADMIGDLDPIRAARSGLDLANELTIHYGLVPRAHRGIFAINELPDLASKIQVGLFNILQEGDVQIKGYPIRLPLDVLMVFTANPEDYTARGRIITPLKDRFGAQVRTHYPLQAAHELAIVEQERARLGDAEARVVVPDYMAEVVAELSALARKSPDINQRSGVSVRVSIANTETLRSAALRRALRLGEKLAAPRITDLPALAA